MKILYMTPRIPYPPLKGDQVVAYHRLRTLGPRHDITLLTFVDGHEDPQAEAVLRSFCTRIVKVPQGKGRIAWNLASRGLWSDLPLQVLFYQSPAFRAALQELLKEDFHVVHAFLLRLLPYLENMDRPVILECIDSMRLNMSRQVQVSTGFKRWVYQEELRRLDRYEPTIDRWVERAIFVSPIDVNASGSKKTMILPNGVELPKPMTLSSDPIVAFSGNMGYTPNIQAVEWFVRHCWGDIRRAIPRASFRILGGWGPSSIRALRAVPGVEIIGRVPDMMTELMKVAVSVAPMQSGSGIQNKVLEAMACGLPVVATSLGLGAIQAVPGKEILVADEGAAFSRETIKLLLDSELRVKIGKDARSFVASTHSWDGSARTVEQEYLQLVRSRE